MINKLAQNEFIRLTEDISQSREFKDWYAGSKLVDSDGNPIRLYRAIENPSSAREYKYWHKTVSDEDIALYHMGAPGPHGAACYTNNPKLAETFIKSSLLSQERDEKSGKEVAVYADGTIIPVYIKALELLEPSLPNWRAFDKLIAQLKPGQVVTYRSYDTRPTTNVSDDELRNTYIYGVGFGTEILPAYSSTITPINGDASRQKLGNWA